MSSTIVPPHMRSCLVFKLGEQPKTNYNQEFFLIFRLNKNFFKSIIPEIDTTITTINTMLIMVIKYIQMIVQMMCRTYITY